MIGLNSWLHNSNDFEVMLEEKNVTTMHYSTRYLEVLNKRHKLYRFSLFIFYFSCSFFSSTYLQNSEFGLNGNMKNVKKKIVEKKLLHILTKFERPHL